MRIFWWFFKWGKTTALIGIRKVEAEVKFHPILGGMKFTFTPHAGTLLQKNRQAGRSPHTLSGINDMLRFEAEKLFYALHPLWKVFGGKVITSKGPLGKKESKFTVRMKLQKSH